MHLYYNRDGIPITDDEFKQLFDDMRYRRVARTKVVDAAEPMKSYDVSTVWLGINHSLDYVGPPLIFETMVFTEGSDEDDACTRYPTEHLAREGHAAVVLTLSAEFTDAVVMDVAPETTS